MSAPRRALLLLLPTALSLSLGACNTVDSTSEATIAEQRMARPAAIVVQPFAIAPDAPVPAGSAGTGTAADDAAQATQKFRDDLAAHLVSAIGDMGLPAVRADAPLPAAGRVMTLEGRFVSVPAGDSAEPAIVRLADSWPDVVVDLEIYDTSDAGDRLLEDMEFRISRTNPLIPAGEPSGVSTEPRAQAAISPATQAKLDAAAKDGADAIARQLRPFFAEHGWIADPRS